ncbi:MAG TPA: hypothetical protein VFY16_01755 [Gemmatimonadaceae bacterium]|nr:hypothetical protein [Gemmatimonadaceae bacterium]
MSDLCDDLEAHLPAILDEWESMVAGEPWGSLPRASRRNDLPGVLRALVRAMLGASGNAEAYRAFVRAAIGHGEVRRRQAFERELLFTEISLLRLALWSHVQRACGDGTSMVDVMLRLDTGLGIGIRAALAGYYRAEYVALGNWAQVVEQLWADQPPPGRG